MEGAKIMNQPESVHASRVRVGRVYNLRADSWARVLVDRLWPRGLTHERADLDWWCKEISPSTELRRWYHDNDQYPEFRLRYQVELGVEPRRSALEQLGRLALERGVVLLTSTRNTHISQAAVICDLLGGPSAATPGRAQ
jgi:uncharacterized protein YeaO (DUF488 family)